MTTAAFLEVVLFVQADVPSLELEAAITLRRGASHSIKGPQLVNNLIGN